MTGANDWKDSLSITSNSKRRCAVFVLTDRDYGLRGCLLTVVLDKCWCYVRPSFSSTVQYPMPCCGLAYIPWRRSYYMRNHDFGLKIRNTSRMKISVTFPCWHVKVVQHIDSTFEIIADPLYCRSLHFARPTEIQTPLPGQIWGVCGIL